VGLGFENILKSWELGKDQSSIDTVSIPMIFYRNLGLDKYKKRRDPGGQTGLSFLGISTK
jgi:hypothetical protein